jgi:hypothetical protein
MDVLTTKPLPLAEWLPVIAREYFDHFVPQGGAAVKFAILPDAGFEKVAGALAVMAERRDLHSVRIDAARTRLHMMHELFFAVARALPWEDLAQQRIERLFAANDYAWPRPGEAMTMAELAVSFGVAQGLLARQRDQWLTASIWEDRSLAQDFRAAILRLCMARLRADDGTAATALSWLQGEKLSVGLMRGAELSGRIGRMNARAMLTSLCHFVRSAGAAGLLLVLDVRALSHPVADASVKYTPAAVMDTYEVLRELIDETEHMPGLFAVVLADEALATGDARRALAQYPALQMRVWPDVRPGDRQNPVAPLVWLQA